jgi:hypothetical protein
MILAIIVSTSKSISNIRLHEVILDKYYPNYQDLTYFSISRKITNNWLVNVETLGKSNKLTILYTFSGTVLQL